MIKLKLESGEEHIVVPTVFPDGTSQVWKLPDIFRISSGKYYNVVWYFESEAEIIQMLQIRELLGQARELFIPFLPYSRQDKSIGNNNTFALRPFLNILKTHFTGTSITTLDVHNKEAFGLKNHIDSLSPAKYILKSLVHSQADLICYPDVGAMERYDHLVPYDRIVACKTRDQATGQITGHHILGEVGNEKVIDNLAGKTVLIVDDICDGGKTFTSMSKMLLAAGAGKVDLYVTHGIFSNGVAILKAAGIRNVYTTTSYEGRSSMSGANCTKEYDVEE